MADVTPGWRHIGTVVAGEAVSLGGLNPLNPRDAAGGILAFDTAASFLGSYNATVTMLEVERTGISAFALRSKPFSKE
jgi:hypothetical protein